MLHYGKNAQCGSPELNKFVFMHPQFIIDAIKYIIREPDSRDINQELRRCDARIRKNPFVKKHDLLGGAKSKTCIHYYWMNRKAMTGSCEGKGDLCYEAGKAATCMT